MEERNIKVLKDKKSRCFIVYKVDNEGFSHTMFLSPLEVKTLRKILNNIEL